MQRHRLDIASGMNVQNELFVFGVRGVWHNDRDCARRILADVVGKTKYSTVEFEVAASVAFFDCRTVFVSDFGYETFDFLKRGWLWLR